MGGFNNNLVTAYNRPETPEPHDYYAELDRKLQGRNRQSRKLQNNTYLKRRDRWRDVGEYIAVLLHDTDVLEFFPDGSFTVNTGGWNTVTTKDRINNYLPKGYRVWSERGQLFLTIPSEDDSAWYETKNERVYAFDTSVTVKADGTVVGADDKQEIFQRWKEEDAERRRLAYWVRKGQDTKRIVGPKCYGKTKNWRGKETHGWLQRCWECHPYGFRRPRNTFAPGHVCKCGCKFVEQEPPKKLTVEKIMTEQNITIRMAMIRAYGIERFLVDAGAETVDASHGYELVTFNMARGTEESWRNDLKITALKMVCPSTKTVYISPVDPWVRTVPKALDWYFNTEGFLDKVTQQT